MNNEIPTIKKPEIIGRGQVISVFLSPLPSEENIRKDFHCSKCGRIVFNHYSDIRVIYQGEVGLEEFSFEPSQPHDIMCSRCKQLFRVN